MPKFPIPEFNLPSKPPAVSQSIMEALAIPNDQGTGLQATHEELMEALMNFLANNAQANTIPYARRAAQTGIDDLVLQQISELEKTNPQLLHLLGDEGSGFNSLPPNAPAPAGGTMEALRTNLDVASDTAPDLYGLLSGKMSPNPDPTQGPLNADFSEEEMLDLAQTLSTLRKGVAEVGTGQENQDLEGNMLGMLGMEAQPHQISPLYKLERILAAADSNNQSRLLGPSPSTDPGSSAGRTGDDRDTRALINQIAGDEPIGIFDRPPNTEDPLIEAVNLLKEAGIPEAEIYKIIMLAIAQADNTFAKTGAESLAGAMDPSAIQSDNPNAMDPNTILTALGLN